MPPPRRPWYRITFERQIVAVQGNTLTLEIPVVDPIEQFYGGAAPRVQAMVGPAHKPYSGIASR